MDAQIVRVVWMDRTKPDLYGQAVALPATYAQELVDEGRAWFERPRPIGFVWPVDAEPTAKEPAAEQLGFPHRCASTPRGID